MYQSQMSGTEASKTRGGQAARDASGRSAAAARAGPASGMQFHSISMRTQGPARESERSLHSAHPATV